MNLSTHEKLVILFKHKIKIYPMAKNKRFAVTVEDEHNYIFKAKTITGEYKHTSKSINNAILEAINYLTKKIKC